MHEITYLRISKIPTIYENWPPQIWMITWYGVGRLKILVNNTFMKRQIHVHVYHMYKIK